MSKLHINYVTLKVKRSNPVEDRHAPPNSSYILASFCQRLESLIQFKLQIYRKLYCLPEMR
ncbi:MAG: hypothetical protein AAB597_02380 [Patescibacteria group bacterium]